MFTGIIQAVGHIADLQRKAGDVEIRINTGDLPLDDVKLGDSIAVSGICLTVVRQYNDGFLADVSGETLSRTIAGDWSKGTLVNLELALTPSTRLGGHLVSGHVDGVGEVVSRQRDARSERFTLRAPASLAKYIAEKGSICVDGVSLTVNAVDGDCFELNIVPHTFTMTTIDSYQPGTRVNLEVDIIARYLERLLLGEQAAKPTGTGVTETLLAKHGFIES